MTFYTFLVRLSRRLLHALPFMPTPASRMRRAMRAAPSWMRAPPHQQPQAFAQHHHTMQQLRQQHVAAKIAPILIDWLYELLKPNDNNPIGALVTLVVMFLLFRSLTIT